MGDVKVSVKRPIPVILDTDIGDDIDDTWALAMLLKSPELDLKLVVSDTADTVHRAKIVGEDAGGGGADGCGGRDRHAVSGADRRAGDVGGGL